MANGGRLLPGQAYAFVACAGLILVIAQAVGHSWADLGVGRWFSGDIPLHMRLNLRGNAAWNPAAVEALRDWNGAGSRFGFSWTQGAGTLRCRADGEHSVVWADELCRGVAWGDRTLAITSTWYEPSDQRIVDADVIFNTGWSWGVYSGPLRRDVIDFGRVALHEFGHVVGLDHPDDRGQIRTAIMNGSVSGIDRLQPDDIDGIRALYGSDAPAGAPDLVVRSLLASPSTVTPGDVFSLSATVRNVGNGTAAATRLNWRYWRSSTRQWLQLGFDSVPRLAPAGLSPESLRVRAPRTPGRYYFNACVVAVAGEQNRGNCADFITVTVAGRGGGAPDLTVGSLRTVPGTLRAGRNFTLHATVRNVGTGTAGATTLSYYYWHSDTRDWERVGIGPVAGLAASGSSVESVVLRAPTTTGTHYYTACVRAVAGGARGEQLRPETAGDGDERRGRRTGPGGGIVPGQSRQSGRRVQLPAPRHGAQRGDRHGGGGDAALLLLPDQHRGVGGAGARRRRRSRAVGKQSGVARGAGSVARRDDVVLRVRLPGRWRDGPRQQLRGDLAGDVPVNGKRHRSGVGVVFPAPAARRRFPAADAGSKS